MVMNLDVAVALGTRRKRDEIADRAIVFDVRVKVSVKVFPNPNVRGEGNKRRQDTADTDFYGIHNHGVARDHRGESDSVGHAPIGETLPEAGENIAETAAAVNQDQPGELVNPEGPEEVVTDKGYHSNAVLMDLEQVEVRSYIPEPDRGKRNWDGKPEEKAAVYNNRRRVKGPKGKRLLKGRGELLERSFAHMYETGGMRRTHLTKHDNIMKRLLVHAAGCNLGLLMRSMGQAGKPRVLQGSQAVCYLWSWVRRVGHASTLLKEVLSLAKSGAAALIGSATDERRQWAPFLPAVPEMGL